MTSKLIALPQQRIRPGELDPQLDSLNSRIFSAEFDMIQIAISDNDLKDILKRLFRIFFEQDPARGE